MKRELIECVPAKKLVDGCEVKVNGRLLGVFLSDDATSQLESLGLTESEASRWAQGACYGKTRHGKVTLIKD